MLGDRRLSPLASGLRKGSPPLSVYESVFVKERQLDGFAQWTLAFLAATAEKTYEVGTGRLQSSLCIEKRTAANQESAKGGLRVFASIRLFGIKCGCRKLMM